MFPAGGSLSLARNFASFKQPRRRQQPRGQKTSPPALVGFPWLCSSLSCRDCLGALAVLCPRAGSPAPGAGSEGRGRGQPKGPGPASPRPGGTRAGVLSRRGLGFTPARPGSAGGRGDGSRPCASSLLREPARWLSTGAGWARGFGHAAREGGGGAANRSGGRRPPHGLAAAVRLPLFPLFPDLEERAQ